MGKSFKERNMEWEKVKKGNKYVAVINGNEGKEYYDRVNGVTFYLDGFGYGLQAKKGSRWVEVKGSVK